MSDSYYGPEAFRHLPTDDTQYGGVIFQDQEVILAESVLLDQALDDLHQQTALQREMPSGWIGDPMQAEDDFYTDPRASNLFWMSRDQTGGRQDILWAHVNGWLLPVTGTHTSTFQNEVHLPGPPGSTPETQFVFLEAWAARLQARDDTHKPSTNTIYRYGNVDYGGTQLDDHMVDRRYDRETSERVQLQYRLRVVDNVDPQSSPYGFNASIRAQGPLSQPLQTTNTAYTYQNMHDEMGDPGLWRAGEAHQFSADREKLLSKSDLPTLDGYVYAIPLCLVFRRTQGTWDTDDHTAAVARQTSSSKELVDLQLKNRLDYDNTNSFEVTHAQGSTAHDASGLMRIGDEIIEYSSYTGTTVQIAARGAQDTHASDHPAGASVRFVSGHPQGYFSDQIAREDIYDLRHMVSPNGHDYRSLLQDNLDQLLQGGLSTQWKTAKGGVQGTTHFQIDYLSQTVPPTGLSGYVERGASPDGLRKVFSDAAAVQPGNVLAIRTNGTSDDYDFSLGSGNTELYQQDDTKWQETDVIWADMDAFRDTFETNNQERVRIQHPLDYTSVNYDPIQLWFGDSTSKKTANKNRYPFSTAPDFLTFGGIPSVSPSYHTDSTTNKSYDYNGDEVQISGIDFSDQYSGSTTIAEHLANESAWLISQNAKGLNGAFRIVGPSTTHYSDGLDLRDPQGNTLGLPDDTASGVVFFIRFRSTTVRDEEFLIVLNDNGGGGVDFSQNVLYASYDLLYEPKGGLSRIPDRTAEVRVDTGSSTNNYLREDTFPNKARTGTTRDLKRLPTVSFEQYPHQPGVMATRDPQDERSFEGTWAEAYIDRSSKTAILQPVRQTGFRLAPLENTTINGGSLSYSGAVTSLGFNLADADLGLAVPREVLPPMGRIDLPVVTATSTTNTDPPFGINGIFQASRNADLNQDVVQNRELLVYNDSYLPGDFDTVQNLDTLSGDSDAPSLPATVCRYYEDGGVRGIEIPPHLGVARIFGIYREGAGNEDGFYDHDISGEAQFKPGTDQLWRQKQSYGGTNLLKTDQDRRSMVITDNQTFVIPESVIDMETLEAPSLKDANLIFEIGMFAFNDWSDSLVHVHTHSTQTASKGSSDVVSIFENAPVDGSDEVQIVSTRTPYQGDVTGTMTDSASSLDRRKHRDYPYKQTIDTSTEHQQLAQALDGDQVKAPNGVRLDVLEHIPFVTTLGTGRLSGAHQVGTHTDIGYIEPNGFPPIPATRRLRSGALEPRDQADYHPDRYKGMTERLPLGLYADDYQFLGEPLNEAHRAFWRGRSLSHKGAVSDMDAESDHVESQSMPREMFIYDGTAGGDGMTFDPNIQMYRTYRGGSLTDADGRRVVWSGDRVYKAYPQLQSFTEDYLEVLEDNNSSAPLTSSQLNALKTKHEHRMQIHGAILFGIAFLVRTHPERVTTQNTEVQYGGSLQMLVVTGTSFGSHPSLDPLTDSQASREILDLLIRSHPTGLGEGFCAADRFRLQGRPLEHGTRGDNQTTPDWLRED